MPFKMDIQYREWEGKRRYYRRPDSNDDWASWWAPDMFSVCPFEPVEAEERREMGGADGRRLYRFPAREGESDHFAGEQGESESQDLDVQMMDVESHRA